MGLIKVDGLSVKNMHNEDIDGHDLTAEIEAHL